MTTRPRLHRGGNLVAGLVAVALFVVLAAVFVGASFDEPAGLGDVGSVTAAIGFAMFDVPADVLSATGTESFLVAFEIVDVVLVAALAAAVMLARREVDGDVVSALVSHDDGGDDD